MQTLGSNLSCLQQLLLCLQLLLAFLLGGLIGFERERTGVPAGVRTFSAICIGSCLFGIASVYAIGFFDTTRIAAQIVTGIGFLGAGVIFKHGSLVRGLTTAAVMWATAAVGLSVAFHLYILAIATAALLVFVLHLSKFKAWKKIVKKAGTQKLSEF
jgi:putative Mg2+ transporter-C (MgtC) family protein